METNTLKILAGDIVTGSKISKSAKLQILNWLQNEATEVQIKTMLLDGEPFAELDEQAEEIVNKRFEVSEAGGRVAKLRKSFTTQAGAGFYGVPYLIYRKIRSTFDACTKKCGTYELNTARRQHCMIKCKLIRLKSDLAAAVKSKNQTEIDKKKIAYMKGQQTLKKSTASFQQRAAEVPGK